MQKTHIALSLFTGLCLSLSSPAQSQEVYSWETTTNKSKLFQAQPNKTLSDGTGSSSTKITIDDSQTYQTVEGFGWTMTQGSAYMIKQLPEAQQTAVLEELFSVDKGMGSATVRVALGASDLGQGAYTYQDDKTKAFSLAGPDLDYLIPVLKEMVRINPDVKFMASPWSAPAWMKTPFSNNGKQQLRGGSLKKEHFADYANYILEYFKVMKADHGINFHSMTIQNEPLTEHNWPSMYMSKEDQYTFVNTHLGPTLKAGGFGHIKLIGYDHNCDNTEYPIHVAKSEYIDGSAFHLYGGSISALTTVYNATKKNVYFTEQWTGGNGDFGSDFSFHMSEVMLGAVNNYAKVSLAWNVASDQNWDPHTDDGGCDLCMGAITIHNSTKSITRNVTYYTTAQMSRVTKDGSVRVASSTTDGSLKHAAFINPDGSLALVVFNTGGGQKTFDLVWNGKYTSYTIGGNTVASLLTTPLVITDPVTGVSLAPSSVELNRWETTQLTATVAPANATVKSVRWTSSDTNIATVDNYGLVKARNAGIATITATTVDGGKTANCQITVNAGQLGDGEFPHIYNLLASHSNKALDVKDLNSSPGAGMQQWEIEGNGGGDNQRWMLEYAGGDIYYLRSKFSDLYLTAGGSDDGAKITQEDFTGNENQEWEVSPAGEGYKLINVYAQKAMDVSGPSIDNGAEVHLWSFQNGSNQIWKIELAETVTALNRIADDTDFVAFPNPTTGTVYLRFNSKGQRLLTIYTLAGEAVKTQQLNLVTNQIDMTGMTTGMYLLSIRDKEMTRYAKVMRE